jgi:hypothetical protein
VFDVYEYLRLTGQIRFAKKMLWIDMAPFNTHREVPIPEWDKENNCEKFDPETGEIIYKYETRESWTWGDLKALILNPESTKGKGMKQWDIVAACRKQLNDESAWRLYFEHQRVINQQSSDEDDEEE